MSNPFTLDAMETKKRLNEDKDLAESLSIADDIISSDPFAAVQIEDVDGVDFLSSGFQVENENTDESKEDS